MRTLRDYRFGAGLLAVTGAFLFSSALLSIGAPPLPPPVPAAAPKNPSASKVLAWDAETKEVTTKPGEAVAKFTFSATNITDSEIVITDAHPSCGCTEAKMPSKPWHLAAHSNGVINVGVNLAGKSGTFFKWVDVSYASNAHVRLNLKVIMQEDPKMVREQNQQKAKADHQAVFRGDCAKCHAQPAEGKMGKELYAAACKICHDAEPRATAVPDLHALNHSTDYNFWKIWISEGKAGTMMPAFSKKEGGPLTDEQIDSLAQLALEAFPQNTHAVPVIKSSALKPVTATAAVSAPAQKN